MALNILKQRYTDISKATIWRWQKIVEGHQRHHWEALLAPGYGGRSKIEIPEPALEFFIRNWLSQNKPDFSVIYAETIREAKAQGWGDLASYKTFVRRAKELPENLRILGREGVNALKQKLPHQRRDYTTLKLHECWESDGRKADVFCRWRDGTIGRPFVVVWREVRTRVVLSVRIYPSANGEIVMESFESALRRANIIPENVILDNGREYANKPFTGGQKTRYRFTVKENEPIGALTRLGVEVKWTTPYHGAAKPIESWWAFIAKTVDCRFPKAYTGGNPLERPEECDTKYAVPIEHFAQRLIQGIRDFHDKPHGGQGMYGKTPIRLYEELSNECEAYESRKPTTMQLASMRPCVFRLKLRPQYFFEIKLKGFGTARYEPPEELDLRRGFEYDVLPDNADPKAPALIYDGSKYIGEAEYKDHIGFLDKEAGRQIMQDRNSKIKHNKEIHKTIKSTKLPSQNQASQGAALPELPQPVSIVKYPQVKLSEQSSKHEHIIVREDGALFNEHTGKITDPVKKKNIPTESISKEFDELERNKTKLAEERLKKWKAKTEQTEHSGANLNAPYTSKTIK